MNPDSDYYREISEFRTLKKFNLCINLCESEQSVVNNLYTKLAGIKISKFIPKLTCYFQTRCNEQARNSHDCKIYFLQNCQTTKKYQYF